MERIALDLSPVSLYNRAGKQNGTLPQSYETGTA